jgi:hypothetical protein
MDFTLQEVSIIISMVLSLLAFLNSMRKQAVTDTEATEKKFKEIRDLLQEECGEKYNALDKRLTSMEDKMTPIWGAIMKEIPRLLISPHTPVFDALVRKGVSLGWECLESSEVALLDELIDKEVIRIRLDPTGEDEKSRARIAALSVVKAGIEAQRKQAVC